MKVQCPKRGFRQLILPLINAMFFAVFATCIVLCVVRNFKYGDGWALVDMYLVALLSVPLCLTFAVAGTVKAIRSPSYRRLNFVAASFSLLSWIMTLVLSLML